MHTPRYIHCDQVCEGGRGEAEESEGGRGEVKESEGGRGEEGVLIAG